MNRQSIMLTLSASLLAAQTVVAESGSGWRGSAAYPGHVKARIEGVVVTGANTYCGKMLWSFEEQGIEPLSFAQLGAYTPDSELPDELTPQSCAENPLLATRHAEVLSVDLALVPRPDQRLENIPLRDVPKAAGALGDGLNGRRVKISPPVSSLQDPFPVYASNDGNDITLESWSAARGVFKYRCRKDGSARISATFSKLIPDGLYSLWGIWKTTIPNGPTVDLPGPLGGVPNVVVPDSRGHAKVVREVPFCPSMETPDGSLLLWATLAYHSDGAIYGGVPDEGARMVTFIEEDGTAFESSLGLMMHHEHIAFPINFTYTLNE